MKKDSIQTKVKSGLVWTFGERIGAQLISTIVTIVLARLLTPEHYGIVSIVMVFITLCNVFVSSGIGTALVRQDIVEDIDYSTAFFISCTISLILYTLLFFSAPQISKFYEMSELTWVIRIMSLRLPIASFNSIQHARVQRKMEFKNFFWATLIGTLLSGITGVILAFSGWGVWALVAQYLMNSSIDTIALYAIDRWIPKLQFSLIKAKKIFGFGWKVLATELVYTIEGDIRTLLVGKFFGTVPLAYYDQGKKYPTLLVSNVNTSINKVMLPAYASQQNDLTKLKHMLRRSISCGSFILAPMLIGFAAVSHNFIAVFLTDKWAECEIYMVIFSISYVTRPLESACHQALLAIGKSDLVLKIMIVINVFALFTLIIAIFLFESVLLIAMSTLLTAILSFIVFMYFARQFLGYQFKEQYKDIFPNLIIAFIMGVIVKYMGQIKINELHLLFLQIIFGGIIYIIFAFVSNNKNLVYFIDIMKKSKK